MRSPSPPRRKRERERPRWLRRSYSGSSSSSSDSDSSDDARRAEDGSRRRDDRHKKKAKKAKASEAKRKKKKEKKARKEKKAKKEKRSRRDKARHALPSLQDALAALPRALPDHSRDSAGPRTADGREAGAEAGPSFNVAAPSPAVPPPAAPSPGLKAEAKPASEEEVQRLRAELFGEDAASKRKRPAMKVGLGTLGLGVVVVVCALLIFFWIRIDRVCFCSRSLSHYCEAATWWLSLCTIMMCLALYNVVQLLHHSVLFVLTTLLLCTLLLI